MPGLSASFSPPNSNSQFAYRVKVYEDASEHRGRGRYTRTREGQNECYKKAAALNETERVRVEETDQQIPTLGPPSQICPQPKSIRDVR